MSLLTQDFGTQSTQGGNGGAGAQRFISWCSSFLQEYDRRFGPSPSRLSTDQQRQNQKFQHNFNSFMKQNEIEDGKRYKAMFRNFSFHCQTDGGVLVFKFLKAIFDLMDNYKMDEKHRMFTLRYFPKLFETTELEQEYSVKLAEMFKEQIQKLSPAWIHDIYSRTSNLIKDGELINYKSIQLFVWLAILPTNNLKIKNVLQKLLNECKDDAIGAVVNVIEDYDELQVFHDFARSFLQRGFSFDADHQRLGFAKIISFIRNFPETEIFDILFAFCESWAEKDLFFFLRIENEIHEFANIFHRHPLVGKAAVKFFKKNKKYVRSSIFGLICQLALISSKRYETEVAKMLATSLSKIWNFSENLKKDGWIYEVIQDLKLHKITDKFSVILDLIADSEKIAKVLIPGLTAFSLQLIEAGGRKASIKILNGRLEDSKHSNIGFIGRWLLVETITANADFGINSLRDLINSICSNASKISTAFLLIDALIEVRIKKSGFLIMNWQIFEKLASNICELPSEVGVKIMSALMPIIIQRVGLRKDVFNSLKARMISSSKVATALPIMLQLFRSLIEQPETKEAFQCSQSFATFSSQLTPSNGLQQQKGGVVDTIEVIECIKRCMHQSSISKRHVYKGLVDVCKKNNFFVIHGLDLLLSELKSLPPLKVSNYIIKTPDGPQLKYPCAHLLKATSAILSAAICNRENNNIQNLGGIINTQLENNGLEISLKAEENLNDFIQKNIIEIDLEDIELDSNNEHLTKINSHIGAQYRLFGFMIIQIYDVVIEHLWNSSTTINFGEDDNENRVRQKIEKLILRRQTLTNLFLENNNKNKNGINKEATTAETQVSDLQIDIPKLSMMLETVNATSFDNLLAEDGETSVKNLFVSWLIHRIYDSVNLLDLKSATCLASLNSLTSLACSLLKFFFSDDPNLSPDVMKLWVIAKTKGLEAYSKIMIYILSKYEAKSAEPLKTIYDEILNPDEIEIEPISFTQTQQNVENIATQNPARTQGDNLKDAGFNKSFRIYSMKHIITYYDAIIPAILVLYQTFEARKITTEFHKQICSIILICRKLTSMLTSSSDNLRTTVIKAMLKVAEKHEICDKIATVEFWKAALEVIVQSNCDEEWMERLGKLVNSLVNIIDKTDEISYKSLTPKIQTSFYCIITKTMSDLLEKIRITIDLKLEIGEPLEDDFIVIVCETVKRFAIIIHKIIKINSEIVSNNELMATSAVTMLSDFYSTLLCITQRFNANISAKIDMSDWESLNSFNELITEQTNSILECSANEFGTNSYREKRKSIPSSASKRAAAKDPIKAKAKVEKQKLNTIKKIRRDEKLFINYEKSFDIFHGCLVLFAEKYGTEDRKFSIPAAEGKLTRDFRIDSKMYAETFATPQIDEDETEEDMEIDESGIGLVIEEEEDEE